MRTWCYFVFRVKHGQRYNVQLPDGGVAIEAEDELEAVQKAYRAADAMIDLEEGELVVCHPVRDKRRRHQAWLMHKDWMQCHAYMWN